MPFGAIIVMQGQKSLDKRAEMVYNFSVVNNNAKTKYEQLHHKGYFACGEYSHALRLTSELVDLRASIATADSRAELANPLLFSSTNMMHAVHHICGGISKWS